MSPQRPEKKKTVMNIQNVFSLLVKSITFFWEGEEVRGWCLEETLSEYESFLFGVDVILLLFLFIPFLLLF
jgi:hypothetical protein